MATFKLKSDLPQKTQSEIDRISAIASAQRTTVEANFLTSLAPYLYNEVITRNASGNIVHAQGHVVPTGDSGFAQGATFQKIDDTTLNVEMKNVGTTTSAVWLAFISGDGAPTDYTDGDPVATGQGFAITGSHYYDYGSGDVYINQQDEDEPAWSQLATV